MHSVRVVSFIASCGLLLTAMFLLPGRTVAQLALVLAAFLLVIFTINWVLTKHYLRAGKDAPSPLTPLVLLEFRWRDWLPLLLAAAVFFALIVAGVSVGGA